MSNPIIEKPKRKTRTSTAVKRRYNEKTYARIYADLPKELVTTFRQSIQEQGVSAASVIKKSIEQFIKKHPPTVGAADAHNEQSP